MHGHALVRVLLFYHSWLMFLVVLVDVIKLVLVFFYILLYGLFLLLFVFFRSRLVARKILEV